MIRQEGVWQLPNIRDTKIFHTHNLSIFRLKTERFQHLNIGMLVLNFKSLTIFGYLSTENCHDQT